MLVPNLVYLINFKILILIKVRKGALDEGLWLAILSPEDWETSNYKTAEGDDVVETDPKAFAVGKSFIQVE